MRFLITGGAGFIGTNLVQALIEAGHDPVVLDNFSNGLLSEFSSSKNVEIVEADIRDTTRCVGRP